MEFKKDKGLLNINYNEETLSKIYNIEEYKKAFNIIENKIKISYNDYLEISEEYSPAFIFLFDKFKKGTFLCKDDFYAMLTYHSSILHKKDLLVYHKNFVNLSRESKDLLEKFDFVFSYLGITYNEIIERLPIFLNFLKVNGFLAFIIPSYWFERVSLNESESLILEYSQKNDKQWLFPESLDSLLKDTKNEIIYFEKINMQKKFLRIQVAKLSSLQKFYLGILEKNMAILETCNIPEDNLILNLSLLIVVKKEKTITKENLFKF